MGCMLAIKSQVLNLTINSFYGSDIYSFGGKRFQPSDISRFSSFLYFKGDTLLSVTYFSLLLRDLSLYLRVSLFFLGLVIFVFFSHLLIFLLMFFVLHSKSFTFIKVNFYPFFLVFLFCNWLFLRTLGYKNPIGMHYGYTMCSQLIALAVFDVFLECFVIYIF